MWRRGGYVVRSRESGNACPPPAGLGSIAGVVVADIEQKRFSRGDVVSVVTRSRRNSARPSGHGVPGAPHLVGQLLALEGAAPLLVSNPRDRQRFEDAFSRARAHKHASLIELGEVGEHAGQVYFTEEYFESQNLRQLVDEYQANQESFTLQEACQIVLKILDALSALHDAGIHHRNLKPENVLVHTRRTGPGGRNIVRTIKVTDAGLADIVNPTIFAESYISRAEARYLAPELSGFDQVGTERADVYSVGVMLYELLVGQPPVGRTCSTQPGRPPRAHR